MIDCCKLVQQSVWDWMGQKNTVFQSGSGWLKNNRSCQVTKTLPRKSNANSGIVLFYSSDSLVIVT